LKFFRLLHLINRIAGHFELLSQEYFISAFFSKFKGDAALLHGFMMVGCSSSIRVLAGKFLHD